MTAPELEGRSHQRIRVATLAMLIVVQVVMLIALNVFDYSIIFPSHSGLSLDHLLLFCVIYLVALFCGSIYAFRRFHWGIGVLQLLAPIILGIWVMQPVEPVRFSPNEYQFLVGKTQAEVNKILGRTASDGFGEDEDGFYVHYNGMKIRYAPHRNYPEEDDRVIAVE